MGIRLSEPVIKLIDGRNYAVLATVNADGSPQTSVMWVGRDGDDVLFSTVVGRLKHRNMVRDPRVSVTVIDSADPENYVELRGTASMTPDVGRRFDTGLSWKYDGKDPGEDRPGAIRVIVRVEVLKVTGSATVLMSQAILVATGVPSSTVLLTVHSASCERRTASGSRSRAASPPSPSGNDTWNVTAMSVR